MISGVASLVLYLGYDNRDNVFANAQLNGQVTGTLWTTQGDDAQRKYDFTYDNAGRLANAQFNERQTTGDSWSHTTMDFFSDRKQRSHNLRLEWQPAYYAAKGCIAR